jgi:hypothetical protein
MCAHLGRLLARLPRKEEIAGNISHDGIELGDCDPKRVKPVLIHRADLIPVTADRNGDAVFFTNTAPAATAKDFEYYTPLKSPVLS